MKREQALGPFCSCRRKGAYRRGGGLLQAGFGGHWVAPVLADPRPVFSAPKRRSSQAAGRAVALALRGTGDRGEPGGGAGARRAARAGRGAEAAALKLLESCAG